MSYSLYITSAAERDMINASNHIEFVLKNPKAADELLDEAERCLNTLTDFPDMHSLVDDEILASWGIRFVTVNNYLAFYIISENSKQVLIIRFLYQKSNWHSILKSPI